MNAENLHSIINRGEGITIEFNKCRNRIRQKASKPSVLF